MRPLRSARRMPHLTALKPREAARWAARRFEPTGLLKAYRQIRAHRPSARLPVWFIGNSCELARALVGDQVRGGKSGAVRHGAHTNARGLVWAQWRTAPDLP